MIEFKIYINAQTPGGKWENVSLVIHAESVDNAIAVARAATAKFQQVKLVGILEGGIHFMD